MFRPVSPGHRQVTSKQQILRKLDTVIHKNESHRLKMQRDLVVVILYGSIYNQYKIVKIYNCKYHKIISVGNNFVFIYISLLVGCMVACRQLCVAYAPPYTHQQQYINEDKIDPYTDNFMIFAILHFYNFILI
jgi:hypothetical protein